MRTLLFSCLLFNSFFAIFFSISNLVLVSGHCQSDQRQLLLELNLSSSFRSTTFATPLGRLMKWNQTKDCCSWEGISCDAGGHVIGLDLSIRGISCPLDVSSSLFRFQHLQRLNLAFNWFKTSFLTGFDKLENLSYLNLSYFDFKRQIPVEISRLTRLVTLDLSAFPICKTSLKLEKPNLEMLVQNLTRLRFLYLDGITISATGNELCRALLPFTKLQVLSMSDCYLSGPIPSCSSFKNLGELNLGDNQLSGTIHSTDWSGLSKLEIVDLSNSKRSGTIPPTLFGIQSLRRLFLSQNQFNGSIGDLHDNNFSFVLPAHIGDSLQFTSFFSLSNNNIQGRIPESLCNHTKLQVLDLSNNSMILNLRRNNLSGITLNLNQNLLEGKGFRHRQQSNQRLVPMPFEEYNHVVCPCFTIQQLHGHIDCPGNNSGWSMLQIFDLASNNFRGKLHLTCLGTWKAMQPNPDKNQSELKHLQFEDFGGGVKYQDAITIIIKGLVLELVKILTVLTSIDISYNNFEGPNFLALTFHIMLLQVQSHHFFGKLQRLESLDLSRNSLGGEIPLQLANLNFLLFLNVSNNKLVGPIPTSTQLQTFSKASFENNAGLCGPPLKTMEHYSWNHLSVEVGFIFGFGIIIVPLIYWKRWRIWYFERIDRALSRLFPRLGRETKKHGRREKQNQRRRTQQQLGLRSRE
ncbi:hypothetical protein V6Z11_A01G254700 [Gossypium hirsutum]